MSFPLQRFGFDPTGLSPNNLISEEVHVLGPKAGPYHPIAPKHGPFYMSGETFVVYVRDTKLEYGVDYHMVNLVQEATLQTGKEVGELILLRNRNEGDEVRITYQVVGGYYQNNIEGMVRLYEAFLADNRPIDFTTGLKNKPIDYPPRYHLHLFKDVIGWGPVIVAMERMINALSLRNVPAFEALIDWVKARSLDAVTEAEIMEMRPVEKPTSFERLLFASKKLNFNSLQLSPRQFERLHSELFVIDAILTNFDENELLFWEISHITTFPTMFPKTKGSFRPAGLRGKIVIPTNRAKNPSGEYTFRVNVRRNSESGPIIATTGELKIIQKKTHNVDYGLLRNGLWSMAGTINHHLVNITPESLYLIQDDLFFKVTK